MSKKSQINNYKSKIRREGFGLLEIVIVTAMVSGSLFVFSQAGAFALKLLRHEKDTLEMTLLAEEGLEAARSLRDESWANNIDAHDEGADHHIIVEGGRWTISHTPSPPIGQYSRVIVIEQVIRDGQDKIAVSGAPDSGTVKVTARVTNGSRTVSLVSYLTDFQQYVPRPTDTISVSYEGATNDADIITFPSNNSGSGDPAQSFTTPASPIQITKVSLLLRRATAVPSNVYAEIRTAPDAVPAVGTSATVTSTSIPQDSAAWVDFVFPAPVSLAGAMPYTIRLRSVPDSAVPFSGSVGALRWQYLQSGTQGPYAGGIARRYIGSSGQGSPLDQYDFGFRVYVLQ